VYLARWQKDLEGVGTKADPIRAPKGARPLKERKNHRPMSNRRGKELLRAIQDAWKSSNSKQIKQKNIGKRQRHAGRVGSTKKEAGEVSGR